MHWFRQAAPLNSSSLRSSIILAVAMSAVVQRTHAVTIDMVTVGNPGNAPDTRYYATSFGSVGYVYQIGKYEVTAGQYTEFLNAVAKADPNGLYNTAMGDPLPDGYGANIQRSGSSPNFSYNVASDWADRPVNLVSFWDAARFANWLHNGQPTGAQGPGTTEGGAYHNVGNSTLFGRNAGAKFFIPSEDEWYKAAYHDKTAGLAANYFDYPTGTNSAPGNDITESTNPGNNANYLISNYAIGNPYYKTVAGEFELSDSPYGTFDQGGNVWEWNESAALFSRAVRGGSFCSDYSYCGLNGLHASGLWGNIYPFSHEPTVGFRVASNAVPEPSTLLLLCVGSLAVLWRRRRLVCASVLAAAVGITCADRADADTFGNGANTFDIEFVTIGNPGNAGDSEAISPNPDLAGSVPYSYRMGKFEISEQMIDKGNAEGGLGIFKSIRSANKPATGVSWNGAARFVNWLNTSSGSAPAYKFAFQPGEIGYNANSHIQLWTIGDPGYNANNLFRNSLARYFLPSLDEWYKAAYYDPTSGIYFDYPTGSDSVPTSVTSGTAAGTAVFDLLVDGREPADIMLAGGLSPYGTMGQGGNVYEWEETEFYGLVNDDSSSVRGYRGGSYDESFVGLATWGRAPMDPTDELYNVGFRVASIFELPGDFNHNGAVDAADYIVWRKTDGTPTAYTAWRTHFGELAGSGAAEISAATNSTSAVPEPSTLLLLCFGSLAVLWRRRGLVCAAILAAAFTTSIGDRANADTFGSGTNTFDIEFVNIGNPGNAADITGNPNPAGSVPYTYRMGQFEISEQMIDKANLLGGLSITKNTRGIDKPATNVSWNEAARFVNWLNTSSGGTPAYKFAVQPGGVGYSANTNIELWTISDAGYDPNNFYRNSLARYLLPSLDEWYKAAYYDPAVGVFYDYPTGSNSAPTPVASGTAAGTAVYNGQTGPADTTLAGGLSPYGTMGQGGNAYEWEETDFDLVNGPTLSSSARGVRSGYWGSLSGNLSSSFRASIFFPIDKSSGNVGFRVASTIPEPSTLLLLCFGSLAVLWRRRGLACGAVL